MNDFNKLIKEYYKHTFNWKLLISIGVLVVLIYFVFTFSRINNDTKEINCITYYTSLGYTANGCEKIIERYVNNQ